jgi:hypothetical protein
VPAARVAHIGLYRDPDTFAGSKNWRKNKFLSSEKTGFCGYPVSPASPAVCVAAPEARMIAAPWFLNS